MTRDEPTVLAALLRERGTVTRGIDQARHAVDASPTLAEHDLDAPGLGYEHSRTLDLWQGLQDSVAVLGAQHGPPCFEVA